MTLSASDIMPNAEQVFQSAFDAFVPRTDDNPDCIPFYRTWEGLKAAWGTEFVNQFNFQIHRTVCEASNFPAGQRYQIAVEGLRDMVARATVPERGARHLGTREAREGEVRCCLKLM